MSLSRNVSLQIVTIKAQLEYILSQMPESLFLTEEEILQTYQVVTNENLEDKLRSIQMTLVEFMRSNFFERFTLVDDPDQRSYMNRKLYKSQLSSKKSISAQTDATPPANSNVEEPKVDPTTHFIPSSSNNCGDDEHNVMSCPPGFTRWPEGSRPNIFASMYKQGDVNSRLHGHNSREPVAKNGDAKTKTVSRFSVKEQVIGSEQPTAQREFVNPSAPDLQRAPFGYQRNGFGTQKVVAQNGSENPAFGFQQNASVGSFRTGSNALGVTQVSIKPEPFGFRQDAPVFRPSTASNAWSFGLPQIVADHSQKEYEFGSWAGSINLPPPVVATNPMFSSNLFDNQMSEIQRQPYAPNLQATPESIAFQRLNIFAEQIYNQMETPSFQLAATSNGRKETNWYGDGSESSV